MQRIEGEKIQVKLPEELLREVERIAKRTGNTRAEMIRNMLLLGTDIFQAYEAVGIVKMMEVSDRLKKTVKRSVGQQGLFNGS